MHAGGHQQRRSAAGRRAAETVPCRGRSPPPSPPSRKNGTSLPSCCASSHQLRADRARARPAPAAPAAPPPRRDDPPPSPAPMGMRLVSRISTRPVTRMASSARCAARATRLSGMARSSCHSIAVLRAGREGDLERVGQRNGLKDGAQFVVAVGPLAQHAQIEIDFCQRAHARRGAASALICRTAAARRPRSPPASRRPLRKVSSTTKPSPTTVPPASRTMRAAAAAVPPVASRSSTISTRLPRPMASCAFPGCPCRIPDRRSRSRIRPAASWACAPARSPRPARRPAPARR